MSQKRCERINKLDKKVTYRQWINIPGYKKAICRFFIVNAFARDNTVFVKIKIKSVGKADLKDKSSKPSLEADSCYNVRADTLDELFR